MNYDAATLLAFAIAFAVFFYVVTDGFDLGLGILFPWLDVGGERDAAMNSIAPVWDGNETWLVLAGGALLAGFPMAYAIVMPAIYVPVIAMLIGLVFRGVAFEFRWRETRHRALWDAGFFGGSLLATVMQGVAMGAMLQGVDVAGRAYGGGWWDWLTPFSLLTGAGLALGYPLLGCCWLIWRTEGPLQDKAFRLAPRLGLATLVALAAISAATPFLEYAYWRRWFAWPGVLATVPVPLLVALGAVAFRRAVVARRDLAPFLLALALFGLGFLGLGIAIFPDIVPARVTIWQAAAPEKSQAFMLAGIAVLVPVILIYTAYAYWVFRGKVGTDGYH